MSKVNLKECCEELSIPYEVQYAVQGSKKGKWKLSDADVEDISAEWLILQRFKLNGWSGINDEGSAIAFIQVCLHKEFEEITGQPFYGYFVQEHDFFLKPLEHINNVCNYLKSLNDSQFEDILNSRYEKELTLTRKQNAFTKADCLALWKLLGNEFFVDLLDIELRIRTGQPEYAEYKTSTMHGRPDLTIWKDNQVKFIEIKAKGDKLHQSQINWFNTFRTKLKLDASLIHVLPY